MGKKKHNPGILDWIVDFFVTPISKPIKDLVGNVVKEVMKADVKTLRTNVEAYAKALAIGLTHNPSPGQQETPAQAAEALEQWATNRNTEYYGLCWILNAIELASVGLVDVAPGYFLNVPQVQAVTRLATDIWVREWSVGRLPLLDRAYLAKHTPLLPETYRLALAVAKGIIDITTYDNTMAQSGLAKEWSDMWREENYEYPPFDQTTELYWRGEIDDETWVRWLRRRAMPGACLEKLRVLRELIPPPADLVTMVVREAFLPEMVTPAPEVFAEYMAKKGFNKEWSDRYWTMHWVPIPLAQAYANLWRGYWTKDDFMFALRIADIHPRWREDIYNVAFRPPSIREMGYGYDMGVYTRDDIVRYRKWGGLSPEDAEKAADALIEYRVSAETEAVRREYLYLYAMERITREEFENALREYKTPEAAIPLWIARGDLRKKRLEKPEVSPEYRIVTSSEALWAFRNGLRDETWTRERLKDLDWTDERINLAIERVKYLVEEEEKPPAPRVLSAAQLRDLYEAAMISKDVLAQRLHTELGYTIEDAAMLADLWTVPPPEPEEPEVRPYTDAWSRRLYAYRILDFEELYNNYLAMGYDGEHAWNMVLATMLAEEYPALSAAYRKGYIDQEVFLRRLIELGMEFKDANELLERTIRDFQFERLEAERDLTKADIIRGVKKGLITRGQGVELLTDLGYEDWEAQFILASRLVAEAGDPESYWEMRQVTEAYKRATGRRWVEIPEEVLMLDQKIREKKAEIEKMRAEGATEAQISVKVAELADLEARLRKVLTAKKID